MLKLQFDRYVIALKWLVRIFARQSVHRKLQSFTFPMLVAAFGSVNTKSTAIVKKKYRKHNERVQAVIPKEKLLIYNFSNSLIIHKEKTKEITTVTVVWKPDLN